MSASSTTYREQYHKRRRQARQQREAIRRQALTAVTQAIPSIAASFPSIRRVYLFGSVTRPGHFHSGSDVDVGVVGATAEAYFAFWRELEATLPEWLIDVRDVSDDMHFSHQIQQRGILLYERTDSSSPS
jgi:predicted nucleotidyltransferase